jgi:NADH-quinone oxidoreductase subunit L
VLQPGIALAARERFGVIYRLCVNKWYFDELIDLVVVRPAAFAGRLARGAFERLVIQGTLIDGTVNVVRASSAVVRAAQNGFLRYYVALLVVGVSALGLYFLLQS